MLYYALQLSLFISLFEVQSQGSVQIFLEFGFQTEKVSEIQTVWNRDET